MEQGTRPTFIPSWNLFIIYWNLITYRWKVCIRWNFFYQNLAYQSIKYCGLTDCCIVQLIHTLIQWCWNCSNSRWSLVNTEYHSSTKKQQRKSINRMYLSWAGVDYTSLHMAQHNRIWAQRLCIVVISHTQSIGDPEIHIIWGWSQTKSVQGSQTSSSYRLPHQVVWDMQ